MIKDHRFRLAILKHERNNKSLMLEIYAYGIHEKKPWNLPKGEIIK
jgi:hypothetical protein